MMFVMQRTAALVTRITLRSNYSSTSTLRATVLTASAAEKQPESSHKLASGRAPSQAADANVSGSEEKRKHPLVEAAFESLKSDDVNDVNDSKDASVASARKGNKPTMNIDESIINAKTVNSLLSITEMSSGNLSRKHALKIVSILSDWSTMNRVKLSEFENDSRFLRICRMLGRTMTKNNSNNGDSAANSMNNATKRRQITGFRTDDLNTVLGVAGDDEAAKLIASISLPQMVKVMSTLAIRKRRSTPLLRSLAFNISASTEALDLKQCADVLFAMASLNFQDAVLAAKICGDIQLNLPKTKGKSAAVGSILTSLGILRYRDLDILESLTDWMLANSDACRSQDMSALFLSSAVLSFKSIKLDEIKSKLVKVIVKEDFARDVDWLNHVWALTMLGIVDQKQIESVLSADFINKLQNTRDGFSQTTKMKILNINSYAKLMIQDYKGVQLSADNPAYSILMAHSKSKQILVNGMLDALKSLLPASNHLKSLVDSKMGFLIDAVCHFDEKRNPLPLDENNPKAIKVALMVVDFHDVCHGTQRAASGITNLSFDLLEKSGYKVIPVPYNEFSTSDKLLKRVQYLEGKFKSVISSN